MNVENLYENRMQCQTQFEELSITGVSQPVRLIQEYSVSLLQGFISTPDGYLHSHIDSNAEIHSLLIIIWRNS